MSSSSIVGYVDPVIANDSSGTNVAIHSMRSATFKGKIDGFKIKTTSKGRAETILDLDFALDTPTDQGHDVSGQHGHGTLIKASARAVISHEWDAS